MYWGCNQQTLAFSWITMMLMLFYYDLFIYVFFFGVVPQLGARDSDCIGARGSLVSLTELPRIWNRRILCSMMTEYQRSLCKTSEFEPFFQPFLKLSTIGKGVFGALKPVKKLGERAFASLLDFTVVFFGSFPHKVFARDWSSVRRMSLSENWTNPRLSWLISTFPG